MFEFSEHTLGNIDFRLIEFDVRDRNFKKFVVRPNSGSFIVLIRGGLKIHVLAHRPQLLPKIEIALNFPLSSNYNNAIFYQHQLIFLQQRHILIL